MTSNNLTSFVKNQIEQLKTFNLKVYLYKLQKLIFYFFTLVFATIFFPLFLIIRIISPIFLIRFGKLPSRFIGHFSCDVNIYINNNLNFKKTLDFFFLEKPICNYELVKLFQQHLLILPKIFILPFIILNNIKLIGDAKHVIKKINNFTSGIDLRDRDIEEENINYLSKENLIRGEIFLRSLGMSKDDKFICLVCRDENYMANLWKKNYDWDYLKHGDQSSFRNCDIENFRLSCEYLLNKGYYVFRMGANVSRPFSINNKKYIDYATLGIRNDFLDIYLSAKCEFFISTSTGIDSVAELFNVPLVITNHTALGHIRSTNKKHLTIFKHQKYDENNMFLNLSDIFKENLAGAEKKKLFKEKKISLLENTPEEIKNSVMDMMDLIKNNFIPSEESYMLQEKFWKLFQKRVNEYGFNHFHSSNFKSHIGFKFLKDNQNFLI